MWLVWLTAAATLTLAAVTLGTGRRANPDRGLGWRLLAYGAWPLMVAGLVFVVRFWVPTRGPYEANTLYPFGPYLNAWAVSFGFTWVAFGLVFAGLAAHGASAPGRPVWRLLLAAWVVCWLPHAIIGVGFASAGRMGPSLARYRVWAAAPQGRAVLLLDAVLLLAHVSLTVTGFVLTARQLRRTGAVEDRRTVPPPAA